MRPSRQVRSDRRVRLQRIRGNGNVLARGCKPGIGARRVEHDAVVREVAIEEVDERLCIRRRHVVHASCDQHVVAAGDERHRIGAQHVRVTDIEARAEGCERRSRRIGDVREPRDRGIGIVDHVAPAVGGNARERRDGVERVGGQGVRDNEGKTHELRDSWPNLPCDNRAFASIGHTSYLSPYELAVGLRYTRARKGSGRNTFISFISLISMAGITLGVAALIVVLSVMNGFQEELRNRILAVASHIEIRGLPQLMDWQAVAAMAAKEPRVKAAAPYVL